MDSRRSENCLIVRACVCFVWYGGRLVFRRSENCLIVRACICSWAPLDNSQEAPGQLLGSSWAARGQVLGSSCLHWAHKAFAFIRLRIKIFIYLHIKAICFHVRDDLPKVLQRRALYRSELPQVQEAPRRQCKRHWRPISRRLPFNTRLRVNTRLRFNRAIARSAERRSDTRPARYAIKKRKHGQT